LNKLISFILFFLFVVTNYPAQTTGKFEPFRNSDYPADKFQIKIDTARFAKFRIEIRQIKYTGNPETDTSSFYCRAWLTITQRNKIITQQFYKSIEPVGGCSGLFIPDQQPRKDFFIFSKFGDYNGSIIIIDTTGTVTEKIGGIFYISKDQRYLFSNYDSNLAGLTVYDLNKHAVIYSSSAELRNDASLNDWYFQDEKYFTRVYDDETDSSDDVIKIATFDFKTNKLVISAVNKNYLKKENKLKVYNDTKYARDCNCGY
jgi:hypothetical protein